MNDFTWGMRRRLEQAFVALIICGVIAVVAWRTDREWKHQKAMACCSANECAKQHHHGN